MKTPPAACDLEAAGSAAAAALPAPAAKVAEEEDPRLRCAFVRNIYGILCLQFVLTTAVAATAFVLRPVPRFFADRSAAVVWPMFIVILVSSPLIAMFPGLDYSEKKRPRNLVLLALFMLCCSISIAVPVSGFTTVDIVLLQVSIITVLGVTLFAIWAAKRGYDYDFIDIFAKLFICLIEPFAYAIVVIPFPLKMLAIAICGFLATLVFSGVVVSMSRDANGADYNGGGGDDDDEAPPAMKRNKESESFGAQRV